MDMARNDGYDTSKNDPITSLPQSNPFSNFHRILKILFDLSLILVISTLSFKLLVGQFSFYLNSNPLHSFFIYNFIKAMGYLRHVLSKCSLGYK